jgi:exoribonuclease-2
MNQGRIIEYIDQGRFICTLCLQDKGNKLHLLTPSNREVNLSPKRALLVSGPTIDTMRPREELLERLRQTEGRRDKLKGRIDVKELWELIRDEKESFDHKYLAQLAFGEGLSDDHLSALVRALFEDRLYFKMKDSRFLPNSEGKIDQILRAERNIPGQKA